MGPVKTISLRLDRMLRVAVMSALLALAPMLVRSAVAQRPGSIQASAYVTTSIFAVAMRPDSATVAARASLPPATECVRIAGVGTIDVRVGPGEAVLVGSRRGDQDEPTLIVEVLNLGS